MKSLLLLLTALAIASTQAQACVLNTTISAHKGGVTIWLKDPLAQPLNESIVRYLYSLALLSGAKEQDSGYKKDIFLETPNLPGSEVRLSVYKDNRLLERVDFNVPVSTFDREPEGHSPLDHGFESGQFNLRFGGPAAQTLFGALKRIERRGFEDVTGTTLTYSSAGAASAIIEKRFTAGRGITCSEEKLVSKDLISYRCAIGVVYSQ